MYVSVYVEVRTTAWWRIFKKWQPRERRPYLRTPVSASLLFNMCQSAELARCHFTERLIGRMNAQRAQNRDAGAGLRHRANRTSVTPRRCQLWKFTPSAYYGWPRGFMELEPLQLARRSCNRATVSHRDWLRRSWLHRKNGKSRFLHYWRHSRRSRFLYYHRRGNF